jgi:hypothetical protein
MKYLLIAVAVLILSCNQSSNSNFQLPPASGNISYVVNQTDTFSWSTGVFGWGGYKDSCQPFVFSQALPNNQSQGVLFQIVTDTLKMIRYSDTDKWICTSKPLVASVKYNNKSYIGTRGDGLSFIEFTSQTDSTVSGVFQFRFYGSSDTIMVHNGQFNDVRFNRS